MAATTLRAMGWMLLACFAFAVLWVLVRLAAQELHPFVIVLWRCLFGVVWLLPMMAVSPQLLGRQRLPAHIRRATAGIIALGALYYAIATTPFAQVAGIGYAAPLVATVLAMLLMRQPVGPLRLAALVLGALGLLLVVRPGVAPFTPGLGAALLGTLVTGFSVLVVRTLPDSDDPRATVVWSFLLMAPAALVLALPFWNWPTAHLWGILAGIGAAAASGQLALARALAGADAATVMPLDLLRLVLVALAGSALFAEGYDWVVLTGGLIVCGAASLVVWREQQLARAARLGANDN